MAKAKKKVTKKVSNPPHRPKGSKIKFTAEQMTTLEVLTGLGISLENCAVEIGVSKSTLERRMVDDPEVAEAVYRGRVKAETRMAKRAYEMAMGEKKGPTEARMVRYWLNCRANWKENNGPQVNIQNNVVNVSPQEKFARELGKMSPEEVQEMLAKKTPKIDS